jgi:hypothetical protein
MDHRPIPMTSGSAGLKAMQSASSSKKPGGEWNIPRPFSGIPEARLRRRTSISSAATLALRLFPWRGELRLLFSPRRFFTPSCLAPTSDPDPAQFCKQIGAGFVIDSGYGKGDAGRGTSPIFLGRPIIFIFFEFGFCCKKKIGGVGSEGKKEPRETSSHWPPRWLGFNPTGGEGMRPAPHRLDGEPAGRHLCLPSVPPSLSSSQTP